MISMREQHAVFDSARLLKIIMASIHASPLLFERRVSRAKYYFWFFGASQKSYQIRCSDLSFLRKVSRTPISRRISYEFSLAFKSVQSVVSNGHQGFVRVIVSGATDLKKPLGKGNTEL